MLARLFPPFLILVVFLTACSGGSDPVGTQPSDEIPDIRIDQLVKIPGSDRHLLGLWKFFVSEDYKTVEVIPVRSADFHLNLTSLLEISPCSDCIRVREVISPAQGELLVYLRIKNIFSNPKLTGFDVRGIFITGADMNFPSTGRNISWDGSYPRLLNAHGYTDIFNPTEYPENGPESQILKYITGKLARPGDLSANLNPYMFYATSYVDDRAMFGIYSNSDNWFHIKTPPGPFEFGYAIDCSYELTDDDVLIPSEDIPEEADMREARWIDIITGNSLGETSGSSTFVQVKIYDKQGAGTINSVQVEAPDLFNGTVSLSYDGPFEDRHFYSGTIQNTLGAAKGSYPLLVKVTDSEPDPFLGENAAWHVTPVIVNDNFVRHWGTDTILMFYMVFDSVVDNDGNTLCFGPYDGGADLSTSDTSDNFNQSPPGYHIAKFDPDGNYVWGHAWLDVSDGGSLFRCKIDYDSAGNVYVTGSIFNSIDFGPGGSQDVQGIYGRNSAFLSKFAADGTYEWTRVWTDVTSSDLSILADSTILVCGSMTEDSVDFDPGPEQVLVDPEVTGPGYITHFDADGNFIDVGGFWIIPRVLTFDSDHNIFVGGLFNGTRDFDPHPVDKYELTSRSHADFFLAKYTSDMILLWVRQWGMYEIPIQTEFPNITDLVADSDDSVLMSGNWFGKIDFDPTVEWDIRTANNFSEYATYEGYDPYVVKYSSSGEYIFAYTEGSDGFDSFESIDIDAENNVLTCGAWNRRNYDTQLTLTPYTISNSHILVINPYSVFIWEKSWGEGSWLTNAAWGPSGKIYIHGTFYDWMDFDPGGEVYLKNSITDTDIFIQRLNSDGSF